MKKQNIGIIGGGAWGTAIACAVRRAGNNACLWARNETVVNDINAFRENRSYLPGIQLEKGIKATSSLEEALYAADSIFLVTPSQHLRDTCRLMATEINSRPLAICAKGVERGTNALMSDVAAQELPKAKIAVMSGPTLAHEVAAGLPAAVTIAASTPEAGNQLLAAVGSPTFRPYLSDDIIGAEIGGAVKNILAIACGIVTGRALGDNARAALITRGLTEMSRLAIALGARAGTVAGLSGLGDLTLTCSSPKSRNMSFGIALGKGRSKEEILAERNAVTEGVWSAAAVVGLAARNAIHMPICQAVHTIVNEDADIDTIIKALLSRPFTREQSRSDA